MLELLDSLTVNNSITDLAYIARGRRYVIISLFPANTFIITTEVTSPHQSRLPGNVWDFPSHLLEESLEARRFCKYL